MIIIVCIDDRNGMMFHHRRQSQDRVLLADLLRQCQKNKLYMNAYSHALFLKHDLFAKQALSTDIITAEDFFLQAGEEDFCFMDTMADFLTAADKMPALMDQIRGLILYRWNRTYPADTHFSIDLTDGSWILTSQEEFAGSSHERITRETYTKRLLPSHTERRTD